MKKILFLDDCNLFEGHNALAFLVEIPQHITTTDLLTLEKSQRGVGYRGGSWNEIMADGKIEHKLLSRGRKSDYTEKDHDEEYKLISGNY